MRKIAILLAAVLCSAGPAAPCSSASTLCSCEPPPSVPRAFADADAVFQGRVINVWPGFGNRRARIRVTRRWKGARRDTVTVHTKLRGVSCGFDFVAGTEYLVYASRPGARANLVASSCSRTREARGAERETRTLHRLAANQGSRR